MGNSRKAGIPGTPLEYLEYPGIPEIPAYREFYYFH
jgi:hypothetical protein